MAIDAAPVTIPVGHGYGLAYFLGREWIWLRIGNAVFEDSRLDETSRYRNGSAALRQSQR